MSTATLEKSAKSFTAQQIVGHLKLTQGLTKPGRVEAYLRGQGYFVQGENGKLPPVEIDDLMAWAAHTDLWRSTQEQLAVLFGLELRPAGAVTPSQEAEIERLRDNLQNVNQQLRETQGKSAMLGKENAKLRERIEILEKLNRIENIREGAKQNEALAAKDNADMARKQK